MRVKGGLISTVQFHTIKITMDSVAGKCPLGNKPGKEFIVHGITPAGMRISAFGAILTAIQVLKFSGCFPWGKDPNEAYICCPDHLNRVFYRLERMGKAENKEVCL